MDELHRRVVRHVRTYSRKRAIKLSHLADRAGVSRSNFWDVLAGRTYPTLRWVGQIAKALDVDPSALVNPLKK